MKKSTSTKPIKISRTVQKRIKKLEPDFVLESESKLSLSKNFPSYLEGFMFICRVVVHSETMQKTPTITLKRNTVKIVIEATPKSVLSEDDIDLAERLKFLLST